MFFFVEIQKKKIEFFFVKIGIPNGRGKKILENGQVIEKEWKDGIEIEIQNNINFVLEGKKKNSKH